MSIFQYIIMYQCRWGRVEEKINMRTVRFTVPSHGWISINITYSFTIRTELGEFGFKLDICRNRNWRLGNCPIIPPNSSHREIYKIPCRGLKLGLLREAMSLPLVNSSGQIDTLSDLITIVYILFLQNFTANDGFYIRNCVCSLFTSLKHCSYQFN